MILNSQAALAQIEEHSISNLRSELGGVLLGHAYRNGQRLVVDVLAALPAQTVDHGPVHFTFTADAWSQIHRDKEAKYAQLEIIGWFHTHPGLAVFYSSDDVVVHSAAFTLPWHIGLVVDPLRSEAAYFGWQQGKLAHIPGFYELLDQQSESVIPWRAVKTQVYDLPEMEMAEALHEQYEYSDENEPADGLLGRLLHTQRRPGRKSQSQTNPALVWGGGLLVIVAFLILIGLLFSTRRQINQLQTVTLTLANASDNLNAQACPDPRLRILAPGFGQIVKDNSEINIIGTAVFPEARRYRLEVRPVGLETWTAVGIRSANTNLGTLATWDTEPYAPAEYEIRLTAVDRNNIRLTNSPPCSINVQLIP
jgi:proteasome lid subunit RPN8/RPN11